MTMPTTTEDRWNAADDFSRWTLEELHEHRDAALQTAADCRAWAHQDGNTSTELERAVRRSIRRYAIEITRREQKEQTK